MPDFAAHVALGESLTPVGRLRFTQAGPRQFSAFSYDPAWIENPRAFALQPTLPLEGGSFHASGQSGNTRDALAGVFSDAAPDSWGRRLLERTYGNGLSEFEYLTLSDDTCRQGALRFVDANGAIIKGRETDAVPRLIDLQAITAISRATSRARRSPHRICKRSLEPAARGGSPQSQCHRWRELLARQIHLRPRPATHRARRSRNPPPRQSLRHSHARGASGTDGNPVSRRAAAKVRPTRNRAYSLHFGAHRIGQDRDGTRRLYRDRRFHADGRGRTFG